MINTRIRDVAIPPEEVEIAENPEDNTTITINQKNPHKINGGRITIREDSFPDKERNKIQALWRLKEIIKKSL